MDAVLPGRLEGEKRRKKGREKKGKQGPEVGQQCVLMGSKHEKMRKI